MGGPKQRKKAPKQLEISERGVKRRRELGIDALLSAAARSDLARKKAELGTQTEPAKSTSQRHSQEDARAPLCACGHSMKYWGQSVLSPLWQLYAYRCLCGSVANLKRERVAE